MVSSKIRPPSPYYLKCFKDKKCAKLKKMFPKSSPPLVLPSTASLMHSASHVYSCHLQTPWHLRIFQTGDQKFLPHSPHFFVSTGSTGVTEGSFFFPRPKLTVLPPRSSLSQGYTPPTSLNAHNTTCWKPHRLWLSGGHHRPLGPPKAYRWLERGYIVCPDFFFVPVGAPGTKL